MVMLSTLDRKLFRDLVGKFGQILAIAGILACGIATLVMSFNTFLSLKSAQEYYYTNYRFAHLFVTCNRAPKSIVDRIHQVSGVSHVQGRIVTPVILDMPEMAEPAGAELVSVPDYRGPMLNELYFIQGRYPAPRQGPEVVISQGFSIAHGLAPGDQITALLNGRKRQLQIVGVATSPEYVYFLGPGLLLPDDRRYGSLWMCETDVADAFDMAGAVNNICVSLTDLDDENRVIAEIDRLLMPYGGLGAYGRSDQQSHKFIENELDELRGMGVFVPIVFFFVAGYLSYTVLQRMIATQREQIATLRAFGYTRHEITYHYIQFVLAIVAVGVSIGVMVGVRLGKGLTTMYGEFFRFPVFDFHFSFLVVFVATLIAVISNLAGTWSVIRKLSAMPPAEAMKPEVPEVYSRSVVDYFSLFRKLPAVVRMIVRHILRYKLKATFTATGIALAVAALVLGSFIEDSISYVMNTQFHYANRQDATLTFADPVDASELQSLARLPGVQEVEPVRDLPVRLRFEQKQQRVGLQGVTPKPRLSRITEMDGEIQSIPTAGLTLSTKLAEFLNVGLGDKVTVEVLEGRRPTLQVVVVKLIDDFTGLAAYMNIREVNQLMLEGQTITGVHLRIDPAQINQFHAAIKSSRNVNGVSLNSDTLIAYESIIAENLLLFRFFNVLFGCAIVFGVVYNSARISLGERGRELATLRVLGFTRWEVTKVLLGELYLLIAIAIPCGLFLGYWLSHLLIEAAYDTDFFRLPLVINTGTYGFATLVTIGAAVVASAVAVRQISQLDMIAVLKAKE